MPETAASPTDLPKDSWGPTFKRTLTEFKEDKLNHWAAALTYYAVLSLFPALIVLVSLAGLVASPQTVTTFLTDTISSIGPDSAVETFKGPIESITSSSGTAGIMAIVGVLAALWSASGYVGAFTEASNSIYEVEEGRPVWKKKPLQILITFVCIMLVAITALALVLTGPLAKAVGGAIGLGDTAITVWQIAKWPVLLGLVLVILHVLYFASPNAKVGAKWISGGTPHHARGVARRVGAVRALRLAVRLLRQDLRVARRRRRLPPLALDHEHRGAARRRVQRGDGAHARAQGGAGGRRAGAQGPRARPAVAEATTVHCLEYAGPSMATALSELTTLRLGGPPRRFVEARDEAAIVAAVQDADEAGEPLLIVAGGSNLVVADAGFPGTVLRIASRGIDGGTVAAGEDWDPFVARCVAAGLAGVECLSGIPGSVGATPIQNVGAYGQEVADVIVSVRAYDRRAREVLEIPAAECGFAYRSSAFKRDPGHWVVLSVTFDLPRQDRSMPIRYAELARALGVERGRDGAARGRARGRPRAAPPQGHGRRPGRPGLRLRGLVLHQPGPEPDGFAALEARVGQRRPPAPLPAAGRLR